MNIDVKNALDKVIVTCNKIEEKTKTPAKNMLAEDIYSFINNISKASGDERFNYFSKLYLDGKYCSNNFNKESFGKVPRLLDVLIKIDVNNSNKSGIMTSKQLISFFLTLGRFYSSNSADKKDVDIELITEQVNKMNDYVNRELEMMIPKGSTMETNQSSLKQKEEQKAVENDSIVEVEQEETLEQLLDELNSLIGLEAVKKEVQQIINTIKVRKKGEEFGIKQPPLSLHLVFYGNPGTGKTTVARKLAKIYQRLGVLSSGQLLEVDRSGLVAGYVGQTAIKTQEVIKDAMGGILFIDEAYALTYRKGESDFGQEAVDTILKAMEDHRDDFIVIVAGYPDLMKEFVGSNPGLKSRFNQFINFEDYTPDELLQIFMLQCKKYNNFIAEDCNEFLQSYFNDLYQNRSEDYANGRDVRNYFENVIKARDNRMAKIMDENPAGITAEELVTITLSDLENAANFKSDI
jgi:SpoVK/Ycf46/Vps4 family AAA+-type ATPase